MLGKRQRIVKDDLRFKPNIEMLADQDDGDSESDGGREESGQSGDDFEYGSEDESEISEDKPFKAKKTSKDKKKKGGDKDGNEVYKPAKLNPIMY